MSIDIGPGLPGAQYERLVDIFGAERVRYWVIDGFRITPGGVYAQRVIFEDGKPVTHNYEVQTVDEYVPLTEAQYEYLTFRDSREGAGKEYKC